MKKEFELMQKYRVYSLLTAFCIAIMSMGAFPIKTMAAQIFETEQIIEAEKGILNGVIYEKNDSSYGKTSVYINTGAVSKSENISLEAMSWLVNIPEEGSYRIFVRGYFSKDTRDDFWIGTNDDEWIKVSAGADTKYKWYEATQIECEQGIKKIKIQPAETDGRFDAIYVTSNSDEEFMPPVPPMDELTENVAATNETDVFIHEQDEIFEVSGTGIELQAGEGSYTSAYTPGLDRNAADLDILKSGVNNTAVPEADASPHLQVVFKTQKTANYNVWIRVYAASSSSDSLFFSFGDSAYTNKSLSAGSYKWYKIHSGKMEADVLHKIRIRSRESGCCIDNIIITGLNTFIPTGRYGNLPEKADTKVEKLDEEKYNKPVVVPPENEHPRVLFRKSDISRILKNMDSEQNAEAKSEFEKFLSEEIDLSGTYSVNNFMRIEANAFDYAINGNKESGIKAKEGIIAFLQTNSLSGQEASAITRSAGYAIYTAAEVYDWCYNLLTPAEREEILLQCTNLASGMEMGWPPSGQGAQTGHGAEAQLLRDFMALAIAVYDERPDLWNYIAGRYYQEYIPTFNFWRTTQYQGSSYGVYRQQWSTWSYLLIKGMGGEVPVDLEKLEDSMLWSIYYRRPDGQMMRDGDITNDRESIWSYWTMYPQGVVNASLLTGNQFLKLDAARTSRGIVYSSSNNEYGSEIVFLIFNDPEVEPANSYSDLPLSKYIESPYGIMVARTGWEDGVESPAVVAKMKVGEWQTNNHQHLDAGDFQIYYKGALASDSGVYQGLYNNNSVGGTTYGSLHFNQYATKTIAHNCMLVYDPGEGDSSLTSRGIINDGGQRAVMNGGEFSLSNPDAEKEAHVANVEGFEIDPTNTKEPNYSYLKGNLTNAYSDKISDYKRSFMFLNLKNEKVPAAMIVFDKIDSSNPAFKKTWLLHGLEEPVVEGNRTVFSRTYHSTLREYGYNGKLTVDTLLPVGSSIKKVGGEDGWSNVNGVDYTGYPYNSQTDEGSTWRIEVSPTSSSKEDYFLNVMQVSDNDKSEYLPVELVEDEFFYGAKISDRVVMFSKSGERVNEGFDFEVLGNGEFQYTICDVASGSYKVLSGEKVRIINVSEDGGVLAFKAEAGKIVVEKTDEEPETIQVENSGKSESENIVYVRMNDVFIYNKVPAVLYNDTVSINADEIKKHFGVKTEMTGDSLKFSRKEGNIEFILGTSTAFVNSQQVELATPTQLKDGVWMIPARAAVEALGGKIDWDQFARTVYITLPQDDLSLPAGYAKIVNVEDDGGTIDPLYLGKQIMDEDAATIWSAQGVGRYVTMHLEKESMIKSVEIMFNPNSARNAEFAIEISEDGKKYTNIYTGKGDGSVEPGTWEKFEFDKAYQTKYIRYVGNGSNISNWNAVQEIRFKLK